MTTTLVNISLLVGLDNSVCYNNGITYWTRASTKVHHVFSEVILGAYDFSQKPIWEKKNAIHRLKTPMAS